MAANIARLKSEPSDSLAEPSLLDNFGGPRALADIALDAMADEVTAIQRKWPPVGDILLRMVDMWDDDRLTFRGVRVLQRLSH
jgi:hypothetical protein